MTGQEFRDAIGTYDKIYDRQKKTYKIKFHNKKLFQEIKSKIKVLARCSPEDKFILVAGIQQEGGMVAMAGHSIADAEALKKANVGICMGSGCDVAKDHSDLVILDNNFKSIH